MDNKCLLLFEFVEEQMFCESVKRKCVARYACSLRRCRHENKALVGFVWSLAPQPIAGFFVFPSMVLLVDCGLLGDEAVLCSDSCCNCSSKNVSR